MTKAKLGLLLTIPGAGVRKVCNSYAEASRAFCEYRNSEVEAGRGGASRTPDGALTDDEGRQVARVSYNGRVWAGVEYTPGEDPIFTPGPAESLAGVKSYDEKARDRRKAEKRMKDAAPAMAAALQRFAKQNPISFAGQCQFCGARYYHLQSVCSAEDCPHTQARAALELAGVEVEL